MDFSKQAKEVKAKFPQVDVLNGIAYEKKSKTMLVTGKWWPALYAVRLSE
jgi:glutamine cyclotransferase